MSRRQRPPAVRHECATSGSVCPANGHCDECGGLRLAGTSTGDAAQLRFVEARERFLKGEWKFSKEQQATLDAARERIKAQAAREVLRDEIKNLPEQQQEKLMGEFESAVAEARAANRPLDVPMPQVSEATIEAVREQIEREHTGQDRAPEPREQTSDQPRRESGHEAGHDAPTLELEP